MDNIALWTKQITGEINISEVTKTKPTEDIVREYYTGLRDDGRCYFNITNSDFKRTNFKGNIRMIFDPITWKLKSVEKIDVKEYKNKEE